MKKPMLYIPLILIVAFLLAFGYAYWAYSAPKWKDTDTATIRIGSASFKVEIAASPLKKQAGLSARKSLDPDTGMLFIFSKAYRYPFWMKGMEFPLDFIWIRDGKVADISKNIPPAGKNEIIPDSIAPSTPADMVLEVNTGTVDHYHISIGESIQIEKAGQ